ncbi:hypothetical protein CRI94_11040 [Longibacter salinarum]|uniref:FAS1 domain-containing protein n=1 Tax=Longibacter salinarum TaxID=1850348 RepID=A0A2A8CX58_9BACT|nr:fasciclin domain-containing protein [Longibacter salinarum]PEN13174.1 hypothetical protein CRI94_11040 [Longibacter salinarum]
MPAHSALQSRLTLFTASLIATIVAALVLLPVMAHAQNEDEPRKDRSNQATSDARMQDAAQSGTKPLLETLEEKQSYSTFVDAMKSTGLANALSSGGPYTIFAPTNQAFQSLDTDLSSLSDQELVTILRRHIVVGNVPSGKLNGQSTLRVTTGDQLAIGENGATVGDARIETPDIKATNGVAHGIDKVLMPAANEGGEQVRRPSEKPPMDKPEKPEEDTSTAGTPPMMSDLRMPAVRIDTTEKDTTEKDTTDTTDAVIGSIAVDRQSLADAGLMR